MVKIYTQMVQEDEEPQLIVFEADLDRLRALHALCIEHDLSEAVIAMPAYEHLSWPKVLPIDGFVSQETRDLHRDGWLEGEAYQNFEHTLEVLHVGANGVIHVELRGGSSGEWWSEGIQI